MEFAVLVLLIFMGLGFSWLNRRPSSLHPSYRSQAFLFEGRAHYIEKGYGGTTVRFYSLGHIGDSERELSDGMAEGIYAIISSPKPLDLKYITPLFDEVEELAGDGTPSVYILKKYGVFLGEPEMKKFIDEFDPLMEKHSTAA